MSDTAHVNMINLVVQADDLIEQGLVQAAPETSGWLSNEQTYPTGMDGDPVGYAQSLRASLPEVNNLRIFYNENSFNSDGTLHPDFSAFLVEAANQGFEFTLTYGTSNLQKTGEQGESEQEIYDELLGQKQIAIDTLQDMISHIDGLGISNSVYGYELINEPQAFNNGIVAGGNDFGSVRDFVSLYLDYVTEMSAIIQDQTDSKVVVGGLGYSRNFSILTRGGEFGGLNGIDAIRDVVGDNLVWSAHVYGIDGAESVADIEAGLSTILNLVLSDDILLTELNYPNAETDSYEGGLSVLDYYAQAYEWFADNGIGAGWYAGASTSASHMVDFDNRGLVVRNQGSFAHANNLFSLGGEDIDRAGDDTINVTIKDAVLRNLDGSTFDDASLGMAFGHGGNDTLIGTDGTNDFIYGGTGNDIISGGGADDYLFGQDGDDTIDVTSGENHLYGGRGDDNLKAGSGLDVLLGGEGLDTFVLNGIGDVEIADFDATNEVVNFIDGFTTYSSVQAAMLNIDGDGDGQIDDVQISNSNGTYTVFYNVSTSDLSSSNFTFGATPDGKVDGTAADDVMRLNSYVDGQGEAISDGADIIYGYSGNDTIDGSKGHDTIYGGEGDDFIDGEKQNNILFGEEGNDTIHSGDHASQLDGGDGDDHLIGKMLKGGGHVMTGGSGADVFEFTFASSSKVDDAIITDFNVHEDTLIIMGQTVDLQSPQSEFSLSEDVNGLTIAYGTNDYIFLQDVSFMDIA